MQTDIEDLIAPKRPSRTSYPGGKNGMGVYQTIINNQPPHDTYIECFVGGGAILKRKRPAGSNIVIDSDAAAIVALKENLIKRDDIRYLIGDGVQFLREFNFTGRELVYADPPYPFDTRSCQRDLYKQEWSDSDHEAFLTLVRRLPCMVMVSSYENALYGDMLHDWHCVTFTGCTRGGPRTECLWFNFPPPTALHDYQYLGDGFRERERIKRKALRWKAKLANMEELERKAVLSALLNYNEPPSC
ncbi:DNA adenine methylase [Kordiimonas aquimaris]|uniref:DNA adenine methylase n=1 Tax=Kordiimonas aquimaris TaxID=707591 RepID=UPI0021CE6372|nr:DNA adenine methylase [Kordiimonas aquimaris]